MMLLAEYGPLRDGYIYGGPKAARPITKFEMRALISTYEAQVADIILRSHTITDKKQDSIHLINCQIVDMLRSFLPQLKKPFQKYTPEGITLDTVICFDDFSVMLEQFLPDIVISCVRCRNNYFMPIEGSTGANSALSSRTL